jgi:hypothetical protein
MATVKFINRKDSGNYESLGAVIKYSAQKHKTQYGDSKLVSGVNCIAETAMQEFKATKKLFGKENGVQYYYAIQSFEDDSPVTPELAHQIAREWVERCYPNHEAFIATHIDTDNIHSHIVINSVRMTDGKKINQHTKELNEIRKINDEICIKYNLPICKPKKKQVKTMKPKEYYVARSGKSWKFQMINIIEFAMKQSGSKEEFIQAMNGLGYSVKWTPTRKNITYTEKENPNHRCRDDNLHEEKFLKINMEVEFELRKRIKQSKEKQQSNDFQNGESYISNDSRERILESVDRAEQETKQSADDTYRPNGEQSRNGNDKENAQSYNQHYNSTDGERNAVYEIGVASTSREYTTTGWEDERAVYLSGGQAESIDYEYEEVVTTPNWHTNSNPSPLNDSLYFVGNLFEMIDNQKRFHRKQIKLSQKEIEKRKAHGQKTSGEDGFTMSM